MDDMEKLKKSLVVQSNKLIEASYRLRIGQQKFLRLMASRIRKDDEDFKSYEFKISDVIELFDVKNQSNYVDIPRQLRELMGNVLTFKVGKTTTLVPFLAFAQHDAGSGTIKVQFHPVLKPMYLCLNRENPFTSYELSNALRLRSTYSLRFYELLKQYQKIGKRVLSITDIRDIFELQPKEYTRYNDLKRFVILQAQKEINNKTDICFEFKEIKTGRKVTAIEFYINSNAKNEIAATSSVPSGSDEEHTEVPQKQLTFIEEALTPLDEKKIIDTAGGDIELIREKYEIAQYQAQRQGKDGRIENLVGWLIKAIKNDYKKPVGMKNKWRKPNSGSNERQYDAAELEKKLLERSGQRL